jgi:hypothetical protein
MPSRKPRSSTMAGGWADRNSNFGGLENGSLLRGFGRALASHDDRCVGFARQARPATDDPRALVARRRRTKECERPRARKSSRSYARANGTRYAAARLTLRHSTWTSSTSRGLHRSNLGCAWASDLRQSELFQIAGSLIYAPCRRVSHVDALLDFLCSPTRPKTKIPASRRKHQ